MLQWPKPLGFLLAAADQPVIAGFWLSDQLIDALLHVVDRVPPPVVQLDLLYKPNLFFVLVAG